MADQLPIFPLNTVLFPGMPLPMHIFEERYRRLLRIRRGQEVIFGVSLLQPGEQEAGGIAGFHAVGTTARLVSRRSYSDGRADIVVSGIDRFRVMNVNWDAGYCVADIAYCGDATGDPGLTAQLLRQASRKFLRYVKGITRMTGREFTGVTISSDPSEASWDLTTRLPLHTWERQEILEIDNVIDRLKLVMSRIDRENALLYRGGAAGLAINYTGGLFSVN